MCLRWKDEKLRVTYDSAVVLKSVLQRQKVGTKERVIRTCKTHTFTQFRMHDIHDKQNCEGTSISKNVQNKRIQHFFKKKWRKQYYGQLLCIKECKRLGEKNREKREGLKVGWWERAAAKIRRRSLKCNNCVAESVSDGPNSTMFCLQKNLRRSSDE